MLYLLASYFSAFFTPLNALTYSTSRIMLASLTALILLIGFGNKMISYLRRMQMGQYIRDDGPQTHLQKAGTPTMGGVLVILSITIAMLLWADLTELYSWLALFVLLSFGAVGFIDDYRKLVLKQSLGLRAKEKLLYLSLAGIITAGILYATAKTPENTTFIVPFLKNYSWRLGAIAFVSMTFLALVCMSNAVNVTDGLDGLAIMPVVLIAAGLVIFSYLSGTPFYAKYLYLPQIAGAVEMAVFAAAIAGAGVGFLWYNAHPAMVFMGDVGALALGAALAFIAVVIRQEVVFVVMSGVFVVEAFSVVIQVGSYKLRKKRVFKMAPLHHHYELLGLPESRVTIRFWIVTIILVLIGLSTLKLR